MTSKKILIISYFFYPEITPRAFRTYELVKEFCKQGDNVTLVLPNRELYRKNPVEMENLSIIYSCSPLRKISAPVKAVSKDADFKKAVITKIKSIGRYFLPRELYGVYDNGITKVLNTLHDEFDVLISISHPPSIHLSVMLASFRNQTLRKALKIAEFSDPMFKGRWSNTFALNWLFGYFFSKTFKYFVVPVHVAVPSLIPFKSKEKIKVIPQGFDLSEHATAEYIPNKTITFAYAGSFYKDLRNPEYFLDFLTELKCDFIFRLYIPENNVYFTDLVKNYANKIQGKLEISDIIPRPDLIYELSKADFLVNFNNENAKMVPSKLIDYAIAGRPIISFNSRTFNKNVFLDFLNRDYTQAVHINTGDYDIKNVVLLFRSIFN